MFPTWWMFYLDFRWIWLKGCNDKICEVFCEVLMSWVQDICFMIFWPCPVIDLISTGLQRYSWDFPKVSVHTHSDSTKVCECRQNYCILSMLSVISSSHILLGTHQFWIQPLPYLAIMSQCQYAYHHWVTNARSTHSQSISLHQVW